MWQYKTKAGTFYIIEKKGRFHAVFNDDSLGSYFTPQQAAEEIAAGHIFLPSSGINPAELGIPEELEDWERL